MAHSQIVIERGALESAGALAARAFGAGTAAILTDETVDALYGARLQASLAGAGWKVARRAFPPGEKSKTLSTYGQLVQFLAEAGLTRADAVFALGGGVAGDMAGFAAATYLRGVKLMQVPTTLLACVDSSVGGKTAVDLPAGKNLVGAFYAPHLVLIDPDTLDSLPEAIFRDGMAEVVKYAVICDAPLFKRLPRAREELERVIARCVEIKRGVVAVDERDTGPRQLLNFGHTFGHAIEQASGYEISHGAAVSAGMAVMARACAERGLCARESAERLIAMLRRLDLPTQTGFSRDTLFAAMLSDKKRAGGAITLAVLREIGRCELLRVTLEEARSFLEAGCAPW